MHTHTGETNSHCSKSSLFRSYCGYAIFILVRSIAALSACQWALMSNAVPLYTGLIWLCIKMIKCTIKNCYHYSHTTVYVCVSLVSMFNTTLKKSSRFSLAFNMIAFDDRKIGLFAMEQCDWLLWLCCHSIWNIVEKLQKCNCERMHVIVCVYVCVKQHILEQRCSQMPKHTRWQPYDGKMYGIEIK